MTDDRQHQRTLLPGLIYTALSSSIIGSLGLLLIPTIAEAFDVPVGSAQWVLTINLLVGAIATPIIGRLTSHSHTKRLLLITLTTILAGSVVAATAFTFPQLLVGRALQGLSFTIAPIAISLVRRHATVAARQPGISALSVTVATGVGIGYPLTGIIAAALDFRFAFWFAAAFVAIAIIVVIRIVPGHDGPTAERAPFDYGGAALLGAGLAGLILVISQAPQWGWASPTTIGCLAASVILLTLWVVVELRAAHPLVRLDLLRTGDILLANATALGLGTAMYIGVSLISVVGQAPTSTGYGIGLPLFWAGFIMVPLSIGSQLSSRLARLFTERLSTQALLVIGAGIVTTSTVFMFVLHTSLWQVGVGMLLFGLGIGLTFAAMPGLISRTVAEQELGSAVSFNQVLRTIGGSVGSAIAGAILTANLSATRAPTGTGIDIAFGTGAIACAAVLLALVVHSVRVSSIKRRQQPAPPH
jgi:predicted MFS family arabinose efflux permease